jgi:hypothetical protein
METEKNILPLILETTEQFLKSLCDLKNNIHNINISINKLNNTYFTEHQDKDFYTKYNSLYELESLQNLSLFVEEFKNIVENKLENICDHEWIEDYIDIDPDRSKKICYCVRCNVTKKG